MRTALVASPFPGLTVGDLLLLELPHVPEEHREDIAWEFTGFPAFWAMRDGEWHPNQTFQRQLREFRDGLAWTCPRCGYRHINVQHCPCEADGGSDG